jgi:hypothetical protein
MIYDFMLFEAGTNAARAALQLRSKSSNCKTRVDSRFGEEGLPGGHGSKPSPVCSMAGDTKVFRPRNIEQHQGNTQQGFGGRTPIARSGRKDGQGDAARVVDIPEAHGA